MNTHFNNHNNKFRKFNKNKFEKRHSFPPNTPNQNNVDQISFVTKKQLLEYIYKTIELSNYKYKLLEYEYDLPLIKERQYYVSPNYNGIHSLLVFVKINEKFLSFIIDRKTLTYNINQIDYEKVKIIPIQCRLDESIYNGSIFDGVLLYNNIDGLKHFVINDIYYFRGKNITDDKITNKMLNISTYLETINVSDTSLNNIVFIVNKLYPLNEIQQLVNVYIPKSKYNKSIKGIAFYPEFSGIKLIYLYNNCSHEKIEESNNNNNQTSEKSNHSNNNHQNSIATMNIPGKMEVTSIIKSMKESKLNVSGGENIYITFKMKKTNIVDVYNLYLGHKVISDGKKLFMYKKIDIAYIPTKECSYFCKKSFDDSNSDELIVKCKYDVDKNRWIPDELSDSKRPDTVDKLKSLIKSE